MIIIAHRFCHVNRRPPYAHLTHASKFSTTEIAESAVIDTVSQKYTSLYVS